jgi:hypothetical protein
MQGVHRTVRGRRETLPCLLTFTSGSTGDESGRSRRRTGERAGSIELCCCIMVVAASHGRRFVTSTSRKRAPAALKESDDNVTGNALLAETPSRKRGPVVLDEDNDENDAPAPS